MESILLSLVSSYLKDYVNNFRKEQISVNFLRGQGVIRDLDINVDAINDTIFQSGAPGLRFTRIIINTLSIDAPIMSLKTKPIVVHIDEMFIEIGEVIEILKTQKDNITTKKSTSKYGFLDRVVDSMSFEVNKIFVAFRALGKMKTSSVGPWTPPVLLLELSGSRYFSTNHSGVEVELEECFRVRVTKRPMLFIYKKFMSKKTSAYLINPEAWFSVADELTNGLEHKNLFSNLNKKFSSGQRGFVSLSILRNLTFGFNICMRKRLDNNMLLGFEIAFIFDNAHMALNKQSFKEFIHLIIGIQYGLSRKDVTEELYGPNPHKENNIRLIKKVDSRSTGNIQSTVKHLNTSPEQFDKEEIARLDLLAADVVTSAIISDDRDDWQRSSLSNDVDPPHFRLVIVFEIHDVIITLSFDDFLKKSNHKNSLNSNFRGINLHLLGVVYSSLWPEHAAGTEGIQQITFKSMILTEFLGIKKSCLLRTTVPLDNNNKPLFVSLLPRGVKELSQYDAEVQPGICFVYKRECDFPPPPLSKRIASHLEMMIGNIEVICNLDSWFWLLNFIVDSWDDRWLSCEWNFNEGKVVDMLSVGSSETLIIFNGIQMLMYPDFIKDNTTTSNTSEISDIGYSNTILPSQIIIDIGLTSLVWKHNLHLKVVKELNKNSRSNDQFPNNPNDITSSLQNIHSITGVDLLNDRFELTIAEISVKVVTDVTAGSISDTNMSNTPTRTVVYPFGVIYATSIDPNPKKEPYLPHPDSFLSPYTRLYYWICNETTISSSFLSFDDMKIECSCVDITRLTHIIQLLNSWVRGMSSALATTSTETYQISDDSSIGTAITSNGSEFGAYAIDINSLPNYRPGNPFNQGLPCYVMMFRFDKFNILLLRDDDTVSKVKNDSIVSEADIILGIQFNNLQVIGEWENETPSMMSNKLLLKVELGGLAVLASNRPVLIVINDEINPVIQLAGKAGKWELKSNRKDPVITIRYQVQSQDKGNDFLLNIDDIHTDELVIPKDGLVITDELDKNDKYNIVSISTNLKVCIDKKSKIILSLQNIDEALQSFLSELLSGAGVIFSNSDDWLDSSILGYIMRVYRDITTVELENSSDNLNNLNDSEIHIIFKTKSKDSGNEETAKEKKLSILNLILDISDSDLILLDIHPYTHGDFVGFGSHFKNIGFQGNIYFSNEPMKINGKIQSTQDCYLFSGHIGKSMEKQYITNIFSLEGNVYKYGDEPFVLRTNFSLKDLITSSSKESNEIANRIVKENFQALGQGMTLLSSDKKGIVHYINNSWNEINLATGINNPYSKNVNRNQSKDETKLQMESLINLTFKLFDNTKYSNKNNIDSNYNDFFEESDKILIQRLRYEIQSNFKRLQSFYLLYNSFPSEIISTIDDLERTFHTLDKYFNNISSILALSNTVSPKYSGYVRKGNFFNKSMEKSQSSTRYYCLYTNDVLYFLNEPYSKKIEHEIKLDSDVSVIDPDDIEIIAEKASLSSKLFISNSNDGYILFDCETLDEKCFWKDILKIWLVIDEKANKSTKIKRKQSITTLRTDEEVSNNEENETISSLNKFNHDEKNVNSRFRSVTKGMLKALTLSKRGVSNTVHTISAISNNTVHASHTTVSNTVASVTHLASSISILPTGLTFNQNIPNSNDAATNSSSVLNLTDTQQTSSDETLKNLSRNDSNLSIDIPTLKSSNSINISNTNHDIYGSTLSELVNELQALREPLYNNIAVIENLRNNYLDKYLEAKLMVNSMRDSFLAMFLGLSILHTIENENNINVRIEVQECKNRINLLVKELHEEKSRNHYILEQWAKAKQLQRESESVLQAITMQHISTVLSMSKQYDDLMEQYKMLRMGDQDFGYFALSNSSSANNEDKPITPQDLIRQLANALHESETNLRQSQESNRMMKQEMESIVGETEDIRIESKEIKRKYTELIEINTSIEKKHDIELNNEMNKRVEVEKERDLYKNRYNNMLHILQNLDINPDLMSTLLDSQSK